MAAQSAAPLLATGAGRPKREIFGYSYLTSLTSTRTGYTTWDFSALSTVALFALHQNTDGSFSPDNQWKVWTSSTLTNFVNYAHARGVKVVPTISFHDGTSTNNGTVNTRMCQLLTTGVDHAVMRIAGEVHVHKVDGVNIDYEGSNQLCPNGTKLSYLLLDMMAKLRTALAGYYISIATYLGAYYNGGFYRTDVLPKYVDSFFIMAYDANYSNYYHDPVNCASYCGSPNGPLTGYYFNLASAIAGYERQGVLPSKIILGVPYYGNTACIPGTTRPGPNAVPYPDSRAHKAVPRYTDSRITHSAAGVSQYRDSKDNFSPTDSYSTWWDADYKCWRESYWDSVSALSAKYDLANQQDLRGVGMWTLDYGAGSPELWNLLHLKFSGCIGANVSSALPSPQSPGSVLRFSATAQGCSAPNFEYYVRYPNGTWYRKQTFSSSPVFDWNTAGLAVGTYTVRAWVSTGTTYQAYADESFTLGDMPSCATATLDPVSATDQVTASFAFTAASTGCPTVQYEYWVVAPDGNVALKRPFSFDETFGWSTGGLRPGLYTVRVWANQYGHPTASGEAIAESLVTLEGCADATLAPSSGPVLTGRVVSFSASASSCSAPQYAFRVRYPNGTWYVKRAFSATPTWSWSTAGLAPGSYVVQVWANQAGADMTAGDAIAESTFTLGPACTAAKISAAAVGTTFVFTGAASTCPAPQYQFWIRDTTGAWSTVQAWSAGKTWTWDTTGLAKGTYRVVVWVNQPGGSMTAPQTYAYADYTLT